MKVLAAVALLLIPSCKSSTNDSTNPPATASELIAQGWQAFSAKDYRGAHDKFTAAIRLDSTLVEAYSGAGWSDARLNILAGAEAELALGNLRDSTNLDILGGLVIVHGAQRAYAVSAAQAVSLLAKNSGWSFLRDNTVNAADIRIVAAEDYFALGDFTGSLSMVNQLNGSFSADVSTLEGRTALAAEIERLKNVYG